MKKLLTISLYLLAAAILNGQVSENRNLTGIMHSISSHTLLNYVQEICNDRFEGRLTGSAGYFESAKWVSSNLAGWGIKPAGDNGTWFQWYNNPYTEVGRGCGVTLHLPLKGSSPVNKHYKYVTEFMPGSTSGNGTVTAEVIYAGYGITAPELGYDDYAGIDVKGKIIMIEREAPVSPDAGAEKFNPWYKYSFHQEKLQNAVRHGAAGMLYNYGPIANPNNDYVRDFIYVHIGDSVVKDIFKGTGIDHTELVRKISGSVKPSSFNTKKVVTIKMETRHFADGKGCNVVGLWEGSDPVLKNEVIIIGAHLDGLGRCYDIIPGANDNASAVAVLMEIARAVGTGTVSTKRSLLFVAFGSEEQGIMGSKAYLEKPVFKNDKSILINMDGVGIGTSIGANAGKNYPVLWSFIENANNEFIHRNLVTGYFSNLGRPRLDAARFMKEGIPSLSFYTFGSENYYHVPQDNLEIIKPEIMEDLAQLITIAVINMANSDKPLR